MLLNFNRRHPPLAREKSFFQVADQRAASDEARQVGLSVEHHLDQENNLLRVLLEHLEPLRHALSKVIELVAVLPAQHLDHLVRQLERRLLHSHPLARRVAQ